ncbi:MAG: flagellar motor switch protein FliN [Candidatus Omnitrophica bacterium]|nr:flagellar motor switch protein FliN [Candidatus Omnitrophota bacterium]
MMKEQMSKKDLEILRYVHDDLGKKISKVLSTLLGKNARMSLRNLSVESQPALAKKLKGEYLCAEYSVKEHDAPGMQCMSTKMATLFSQLLMGEEKKEKEQLAEKSIEVCAEALKKTMEAQSAVLEQQLGKKYTFELTDAATAVPADRLKAMGQEKWMLVEYTVGVNGFFEESLYELVSFPVAAAMVEAASGRVSPQGKVGSFAPEELTPRTGARGLKDLSLLLDTPLSLAVELGHSTMNLKEILELGIGSIVELDKLAGEPVDIKVNNKLLAKGEVVVVDESFGVRIVNIVKPNERI